MTGTGIVVFNVIPRGMFPLVLHQGRTDLSLRIRGICFVYRSRNTHSWDMFLCTDLGMHIRGICF